MKWYLKQPYLWLTVVWLGFTVHDAVNLKPIALMDLTVALSFLLLLLKSKEIADLKERLKEE